MVLMHIASPNTFGNCAHMVNNIYRSGDGMQSTPRPFVRVVEVSRMYQKNGMPSRLFDMQWLCRETVHQLRGQHEWNKTEHQNAVMGCGTCCNVIGRHSSSFVRQDLVFCGC